MPIDVTIVKSPEQVNIANPSRTFSENGGSIGRGTNNTWVLDDPEKYMSSVHVQIGHENGQYTLTDVSTNGTFFNGAMEPLGNGNKVSLKEGDCFAISDYEFTISRHDVAQAGSDPFAAANPVSPADPFGASPFSANDPFGLPANAPIAGAEPQPIVGHTETDPLAVLDKASADHHTPPQEQPLFDASLANNGDALNDAISWPQANVESGLIPDNWDDDPAAPAFSHNSAPSGGNDAALSALENECRTLREQNKLLTTELAMLKRTLKEQTTSAPQATRPVSAHDRALIDAMGLSKWNLDDEKILRINETAGHMMRDTMEGMMQVLGFRKKIKEEFRINVTTIQPVENNPLKFSANIEDAMENMFIKENKAYKAPVDALREGFQGISEHQVAVLAGMQAAFRGMLERLDPATLEERFEKYKKAGVIQLGMKRKHWESYKDYHAEMTANLDNSFQHLFGYDFVQAYEEQMQRLVAARKQP